MLTRLSRATSSSWARGLKISAARSAVTLWAKPTGVGRVVEGEGWVLRFFRVWPGWRVEVLPASGLGFGAGVAGKGKTLSVASMVRWCAGRVFTFRTSPMVG